MDGLKLWQKILLVLAVVALGFGLWYSLSGPKVHQPSRIMLADIETGDLYYVKTSGKRLAILPAKNPETGKRTLYPVKKDENNNWIIAPLLSDALDRYDGDAAAVKDKVKRVVEVSGGSPRPIKN